MLRVGDLFACFMYSSQYLQVTNSHFTLPTPSSLVTLRLFSMSVSCFICWEEAPFSGGAFSSRFTCVVLVGRGLDSAANLSGGGSQRLD